MLERHSCITDRHIDDAFQAKALITIFDALESK